MRDPSRQPGSLTVLQSFRGSGTVVNPYTVQLSDSLRDTCGLSVHPFEWRFALTGRYDVFHAHWPEALIERRGTVNTVLRQLLYLVLLVRLRIRRIPIVRTVHNLALPTGIARQQIWLLRLTERWTTLRIAINDATQTDGVGAVAVIPHGHYRQWFADYPRAERVPGRIVFFGRLRRYKRADLLISAFRELSDDGDGPFTLRIAGRPSSPVLAEQLRALADPDSRISIDPAYVDDARLVREISAAELVVLPYPEMHNSGSVLAAVSLDRPVLVPDNEVNRRLGDELGPGWVFRYGGELTAETIRDTIRAVRAGDHAPVPDLSGRAWPLSAQLHCAAYRRAATLCGGRHRRRAASAGVGGEQLGASGP